MIQFGSTAWPRMVDGLTDLAEKYFNKIWHLIDTRLHALEQKNQTLDGEIVKFQTLGLDRVDQVLGPVLETVQTAAEVGFLTAQSTTSATLAVGVAFTLDVRPEDRPLFSPTPWVAIERQDNADDYAVCRLDGYNRDQGQITLIPVDVYGDPGPHSDWVMSSMAGSLLAGKIHRLATEAARDLTLGYRNTAKTYHDDALIARDVTEGYRDAAGLSAGMANTKAGEALSSAGIASDKAGEASDSAEAAAQSVIDAAAIAGFDANDYYDKIETDTQIATAVSNLLDGAPGALDTLNELAAAINDDASFAATITASLAALSTVATTGSFNDLTDKPETSGYNYASSMMFS